MAELRDGLLTLIHLLRPVLLAGGVVLAAVASADWAARTRRLNPFGAPARFLRANVDPRLAGIERQVVRAGGHPSMAALWALVAYAVGAALLLAALGLIGDMLYEASAAASAGAEGVLVLAIHWGFNFLRVALLIRVFGSWFPRLAYSRWLSWSFGATEWMLRPLRRIVPTLGMIDITPIIAYFGLQGLEWLVLRILFPGFR